MQSWIIFERKIGENKIGFGVHHRNAVTVSHDVKLGRGIKSVFTSISCKDYKLIGYTFDYKV